MGFSLGQPGGPVNTTETRRTHRWIWRTVGAGAVSPQALLLLASASRPSGSFEEVELHHNQEEAWFAGKTKWESITMNFYDAEQDPDSSAAVWDWVNTVSTISAATVDVPSAYKQDAEMDMVTGQASPNETWSIKSSWPQATNWMDLDYSSSDIQRIEVTLRYDRAERQ